MFKQLRDALERALAAATPPPDLGEIAARMREAVIEQKALVRGLEGELAKAEELLSRQKAELATAERRRALAEGIHDEETVAVAQKFIVKLGARVAVLEKKVVVQRDEIALAEKELAEMTAQLQEAARHHPTLTSERSVEAAWQGLGRAGMDRPDTDLEGELLKGRMDRAAREAQADAKLDELKKKMGRE
jgi:activator of 2-hydroxyglutaryl-CoA dehydratase